MKRIIAAFGLLSFASGLLRAAEQPPVEWIDPATGHRVIRLSRAPGTGSLYFHYNAYTSSGDKMVVTTSDGLATINLNTRESTPLVTGRASKIIVGRQTRQVFYLGASNQVFSTDMDSGQTRRIVRLPSDFEIASAFGLSADEKLLSGSCRKDTEANELSQSDAFTAEGRRRSLRERWENRLPMALFTIHVETGELKTFHESTNWLNHVQMSPSDPGLILFCHEGPWHEVDRIWAIRTDGTGLKLIHKRTMDREIAGHEFFGADGRTIWYDLQTPRGREFWLAGHVPATGETVRYKLDREHWSVHYNVSPDGKFFAGDGGGPNSVAAPGNGQWIYLFTPKEGRLEAERLVDMSKHDYSFEPNVSFTPDGRWIVFRSNMHGAAHTYAVAVRK